MGVRDGYQPGTVGTNASGPKSSGTGVRGGYTPSPTAAAGPPPPSDLERKVINSFNSLPQRERNSTLNRLKLAAQKGDAGARRKIELLSRAATPAPKDENYGPKSSFGQFASGVANDAVKMAIDPFVGGTAGEDNVQRGADGRVTSFDAGKAVSQRDIAIKGVESRFMYGRVPGTKFLPEALGGGVRATGAAGSTVKAATTATDVAQGASRTQKAITVAKDTAKVANRVGAQNAAASGLGSTTSDNIDQVAGTTLAETLGNIGKTTAAGYAGGAAFGVGGKAVGAAVRGAAKGITNAATHAAAHNMARTGAKVNEEFQAGLKALADEHGGISFHKPGPVKTRQRIAEKAKSDYAGDVNQVRDSVRGTMAIHDPAQVEQIIKDIAGKYEVTRIKNDFDAPGYQDAKINVKLPNGKEGEILITTPEMLTAKHELGGHKLYKEARVTADATRLSELEAQMHGLYADAQQKTQARLGSAEAGASTSRPSTSALAGEKGAPVDTTVPRATLPSESTRTVTSPTSNQRVPGVMNEVGIDNSPFNSTVAQTAPEVKTGAKPKTIANDYVPEADGSKERKFVTSVKDSPDVSAETKKLVEGTYDPISNKESIAKAEGRIKESEGAARDYVLNARKPTAEHTATAIKLIETYDKAGRNYEAAEIAEHIARKLTEAGQAVQAASILGRLSPEGISIYAERLIQKINQKRAEGLFGKWAKQVEISPETSANLREMAKNIEGLEGDAKIEAQQELQATMQAMLPATVGRKVATVQTIHQLLNPKTIIRNLFGNELFYRIERLNKYVATPIDIARSKLTGGDRTVTFRTAGQGKYWQNFLTGAKAGWKGVSPDGIDTQFDLRGQAFSGKWNPYTYLEKMLGATLKGFDFAAYKRAVGNTLGEMAELSAINKGLKGPARKAHIDQYLKNVPKNVLDIADQYGKYVTFQDSNVLSDGLTKVKKGLNFDKDFGLGDIVLKYPKTPANLIMRGLDYSPAGFLKSAYLLAKPYLSGRGGDPREVTLALSRAIVGTAGFTGMGYFLADQGIITGRASKDKDVNALQKQTGDGSYRVNLTGLRRWVFSGFNKDAAKPQEGDYFASYDWAQPIAMSISLGANANQAVKKMENLDPFRAATASIGDSIQTVADQPVLKGLTDFVGGGYTGITGSLARAATGTPASFTPTLSNQIRQITDTKQREAYTGSALQQAISQVVNKIPGLSQNLAPKVDTLGKALPSNQGKGAERVFNVFLNPSISQRYQLTPAAKLVVDLYDKTGQTTQVPRMAAKTVTVDGKSKKLTATEYSTLQQFIGSRTNDSFERLNKSAEFNALSDNDKILVMSRVMTLIGQDARTKMFGATELTDDEKRAKSSASKSRSSALKSIAP